MAIEVKRIRTPEEFAETLTTLGYELADTYYRADIQYVVFVKGATRISFAIGSNTVFEVVYLGVPIGL